MAPGEPPHVDPHCRSRHRHVWVDARGPGASRRQCRLGTGRDGCRPRRGRVVARRPGRIQGELLRRVTAGPRGHRAVHGSSTDLPLRCPKPTRCFPSRPPVISGPRPLSRLDWSARSIWRRTTVLPLSFWRFASASTDPLLRVRPRAARARHGSARVAVCARAISQRAVAKFAVTLQALMRVSSFCKRAEATGRLDVPVASSARGDSTRVLHARAPAGANCAWGESDFIRAGVFVMRAAASSIRSVPIYVRDRVSRVRSGAK